MSEQRRNFLKQMGSGLGGFLVNPKAGVLGLFAGAMAGGASAAEGSGAESAFPRKNQLLLRSGDPINLQGHSLGGEITALAMIEVPSVNERSRQLLVVGHAGDGVTVLELFGEAEAWRHELASSRNRRFRAADQISLVSATVDKDASGPDWVRELLVTPWDTVLVATETLFELDPRQGTLVRLADFEGLSPRGLELRAVSGCEARLAFTNEFSGQPLCFETAKKYSARERAEAKRILRSGVFKEMSKVAHNPSPSSRTLTLNGLSAKAIEGSSWALWS